jgi:hypothetical protein
MLSRSRPRAGLGAGLALLLCTGAACNRAPQPKEAEPLRREASHSVPFVLELYGPASPSGDTLTLTAKLRGSGAVLPVDLEVVTPRGAALSEGAAQERVRLSAEQPLLERRYTLTLLQPLGEPVRVRARLADNPAVGAFAERTYPPPPESTPAAVEASAPTAGRILAGVPIGRPIDAVRQN